MVYVKSALKCHTTGKLLDEMGVHRRLVKQNRVLARGVRQNIQPTETQCERGQRTKAVYNSNAMVTVGKHLFLAGISGSSHACDTQ